MNELSEKAVYMLEWATDVAVAEAMAWLQQDPRPLPPRWDDFFPRLARRLHDRLGDIEGYHYGIPALPTPQYEEFCAIAKEAGIAAVAEAVEAEAEAKRCLLGQ